MRVLTTASPLRLQSASVALPASGVGPGTESVAHFILLPIPSLPPAELLNKEDIALQSG